MRGPPSATFDRTRALVTLALRGRLPGTVAPGHPYAAPPPWWGFVPVETGERPSSLDGEPAPRCMLTTRSAAAATAVVAVVGAVRPAAVLRAAAAVGWS